MEIENLIRHTRLSVGLMPLATRGKACLHGLYRIIYSKTISRRLSRAKPACAGESEITTSPRLCWAKLACAGPPAGYIGGRHPGSRTLQGDGAPGG